MNLKKIAVGTLISLVMISCGSKKAEVEAIPQEFPVQVMKKTSATLESAFPATLKGQQDVEVRPRIDGWIDEIYVDEGSVVTKGQRLFKINSPQAESNYRTAEAALKSAKANVNTAKLNVDRIRPLAEKGIVSIVQLETNENAYLTAVASQAQAQASLVNAQEMLKWSTVTSQVSGIVGTIPYRKGNLVNSANVLTTVANTEKIYAHFSMNEKEFLALLKKTEGTTQAEKIKNLPEVSLVLSNGTKYENKGKIETISGSISIGTGTVNFRAQFPNKEGKLRSGLSTMVYLPEILDNVYVIPQEATFNQQDRVVSYVVQGDSTIRRLIDVRSMPDGKRYAVTGGLEDNEMIVKRDIRAITPGIRIKPVVE